jgi:hypothetical protein
VQQLKRVQSELDELGQLITAFDPALPPESISAEWVRAIQKARTRRDEIFGSRIAADPGWDILLELYAIELENGQATITDVCKAAGVANTTGLRWVGELQRMGLLTRMEDESDRRATLLRLSSRGLAAMNEYFDEPLSKGDPL